MRPYGSLPWDLGKITILPKEVFYYLYLPISMPGMPHWHLPQQLYILKNLIYRIAEDEPDRFRNEHVYLTAKRMYVSPSVTPNRLGWHADGFMSDDLNYVWYDCIPTLFSACDFPDVPPDHLKSLEYFERKATFEGDTIYECMHLLKLDQAVVHRVQEADRQVMRTFLKVSISPNRYNLTGNSHNYELDYDWPMVDRLELRNDPAAAGLDYSPPKGR